MFVRFNIDAATGEPHIHLHGVSEAEALQVLRTSTDRGPARDGAFQAIGQTRLGRYLKVIYIENPDNIFVVTAYDLRGRELKAFRRRRRKR